MSDTKPFATPPRWLIPWISKAHVRLYRWTDGKVGARIAGKPGILVRTIGAKSADPHTVCLPFVPHEGDRVVVASFAGGPKHPAWYHNLVANPEVKIRDHADELWVRAETIEGDHRDLAWRAVIADSPWYADYQDKTERKIPLVRLVELDR